MPYQSWLEPIIYVLLLIGLTPLAGFYIFRVLDGGRFRGDVLLRPLETAIYRLSGIDPARPMAWREYLLCLLLFNGLGVAAVFGLQLAQGALPLNPQGFAAVSPLLAFNTAVSFATNTNWQAYSGEVTLSYFTQMLGLTVQNFLSAATGLAVMAALARGLTRREDSGLGNFWSDVVRATVYLLLPLSLLLAVVLMSQGVIQNFGAYVHATTLAGQDQLLPMGPAASQIAIKQLGTNGGGFFGANSAHPFENPTPLSNFLEMFAILILPAGCAFAFGLMVKSRRHGAALLAAMFILFLASLTVGLWAESRPDPSLFNRPLLEGKETRFGTGPSVIWAMATTVASNGSVNAMHDSMAPLTGGLALFNIMLGEVVFGGVGSGLYGMVLFVALTVFIAGLMVGRTPEYLGKKIEARDITCAAVGVLAPGAALLLLSSLACVLPAGLSSLANRGPHGLTEVLYAFASAANNNGSAFAGLNANTPFYNLLTALAMLVGRFGVIVPVLMLAGNLARKRYTPPSAGTFPTEGLMFVVLLTGVILIVGALTFFPALSLGPIMEQFLMAGGRTF